MKKFLALALIMVLSLGVLCACGIETNTPVETTAAETVATTVAVEEVDYEEVYKEILDSTYELAVADKSGVHTADGQVGIMEVVGGYKGDEALGKIGYTFMDLTGDGFSELIIGHIPESGKESYSILSAYTIAHDMPWLLIEGWARNSYYLLDDGTFFYMGSGGAAYSVIGNYRMSQGGTSLICNDYYFTEPDENDANVLAVYHNTNGKPKADRSERTDLTIEDFSEIRKDWEDKRVSLELKAFSEYK